MIFFFKFKNVLKYLFEKKKFKKCIYLSSFVKLVLLIIYIFLVGKYF